MLPILLNINGFTLGSFTVFLYIAFIAALFIIWRIARYYEIDSEKTLDLYLITSLVSLIGARLYFVAFHSNTFDEFGKVVNIFRYPGYSFWGGLLIGAFILWYMAEQLKVSFLKFADIAFVGLTVGLSISSFGCLLGGCGYGQISNSVFAVSQIGIIGKRFPLQAVEGVLFLLLFFYLWKLILKYHLDGAIAARGLIIFGVFKLVLESFRGDLQKIANFPISLGTIFSCFSLILGILLLYKTSRKTPLYDLRFILKILISDRKRKSFIFNIQKSLYNLIVNVKLTLPHWRRRLFRKLNVKSNPTKF